MEVKTELIVGLLLPGASKLQLAKCAFPRTHDNTRPYHYQGDFRGAALIPVPGVAQGAKLNNMGSRRPRVESAASDAQAICRTCESRPSFSHLTVHQTTQNHAKSSLKNDTDASVHDASSCPIIPASWRPRDSWKCLPALQQSDAEPTARDKLITSLALAHPRQSLCTSPPMPWTWDTVEGPDLG
jgi:hypothetical protein